MRPLADRAMLLQAALHETSGGRVDWRGHVLGLREDVSDSDELAATVDLYLKSITNNTQRTAEKAHWESRRRNEEQQTASDHASWIQFWREIADTPDVRIWARPRC
ncbi:MAG: hypothetical protein WDN04_00260 [Rhodospirillales bacterium]